MQSNLDRIHAAFPARIKSHGFVNERSPGLRGNFVTVKEGDKLITTRAADNFRLEIDLAAALTSNEGSRTDCMALCGVMYPYPGINNTDRFFIPASAIVCRTPTKDEEMAELVCEGYICLETKIVRIDCADHLPFWFAIGDGCMAFC